MENNNGFTEGKVLSPLIRFALPILFAIFLQTMYGAVDMLVVGQFCHAGEVSAVSTGSWIMQTVTSFITGLTMGTTVLLGNRIGSGKSAGWRPGSRGQHPAVSGHWNSADLSVGTVGCALCPNDAGTARSL